MHDVYRVTTCTPRRGHIVAASRLQVDDAIVIDKIIYGKLSWSVTLLPAALSRCEKVAL